jgi:transcriptional regulator with XRE-family HTH domain
LDKEVSEEVNLVKKTCKELGITQKELAKRIGVSERTISTWAKGKFEPHIEILLKALINEHKYSKVFENISIIKGEYLDKLEDTSIYLQR